MYTKLLIKYGKFTQCKYISIYIYIYRETEKKREIERDLM